MATRRSREQRDPFAEAARELEGPAQIGPPEVASLPGGVGYSALFRVARARLTIDQLRNGREGLRGEVQVEVGPFRDGAWRMLTGGRLELSSMSQRETWERRLRKHWGGCNWDAVLDGFCNAVRTAEKHLDDPGMYLGDAGEGADDDESLLAPLLLAELPTLWFGDGGTLKSFLALAAAVSVQCGDGFLAGLQPSHTARVLYLDFELSAKHHKERMRRLLSLDRSTEADVFPRVAYLNCKGATLPSQVERVQRAVREFGANYLIVDSVTEAAEGPLNDDETPRLYYRALGQIGLPSLSIAHVPKNGDPRRPFGSAHWFNLTRLAWRFDLVGEPGPETALKLTCLKASTELLPPPVGLTVSFEAGRGPIHVTRADAGSMVGRADELWRQVRALLARENRTMTYREIALALAAEPESVRRRVGERKDVFLVMPSTPGSREMRVALLRRGDD